MKHAYRWLVAGLAVMVLLASASRARGAAGQVEATASQGEEATVGLAEPRWKAQAQGVSVQAMEANPLLPVGSVLKFALLLAAFSMAVLPISAGVISMAAEVVARRR